LLVLAVSRKGFPDAGFPVGKLYFSEIDKRAISVYQKHFPEAIGLGDVTTITDVSRLGKIDIITFGFPCQDLSVAGKRAGIGGASSGLFFEAIRLIKQLQPSIFIFENVKGLLTNNRGADFKRCLLEIADLRLYECEWQLVNTRWLIPQHRERVYFIGHIARGHTRKVFPLTKDDFIHLKRNTLEEKAHGIASTLTARGYSSWVGNFIKERTKRNPQSLRVNTMDGNAVCLNATGGGWRPKNRIVCRSCP